MLKLPQEILLSNLPQVWATLEAAMRAELAHLTSAAGQVLRLNAATLETFDSSALSLLLSARRLCVQHALELRIEGVPPKLRELARVYELGELLWP
ncbi:STAS domain-containing protein [Pelomonas sp. CA6]|uniref:STAS domain-containing protein n=1 Tax=Pelomonas sp. CA6 TaxID=2907999 RepID=UPI001F4C3875|nr:STAS domain-containing protein [Pelomonas sp. CA6]MCH7343309.1 STAS domain-containing protein [Pelomonas sp. CA6]